MAAIKEQIANSRSVSEDLEDLVGNMTSKQLFDLADQIRTQVSSHLSFRSSKC